MKLDYLSQLDSNGMTLGDYEPFMEQILKDLANQVVVILAFDATPDVATLDGQASNLVASSGLKGSAAIAVCTLDLGASTGANLVTDLTSQAEAEELTVVKTGQRWSVVDSGAADLADAAYPGQNRKYFRGMSEFTQQVRLGTIKEDAEAIVIVQPESKLFISTDFSALTATAMAGLPNVDVVAVFSELPTGSQGFFEAA